METEEMRADIANIEYTHSLTVAGLNQAAQRFTAISIEARQEMNDRRRACGNGDWEHPELGAYISAQVAFTAIQEASDMLLEKYAEADREKFRRIAAVYSANGMELDVQAP